jgi:hypothetical protein
MYVLIQFAPPGTRLPRQETKILIKLRFLKNNLNSKNQIAALHDKKAGDCSSAFYGSLPIK